MGILLCSLDRRSSLSDPNCTILIVHKFDYGFLYNFHLSQLVMLRSHIVSSENQLKYTRIETMFVFKNRRAKIFC